MFERPKMTLMTGAVTMSVALGLTAGPAPLAFAQSTAGPAAAEAEPETDEDAQKEGARTEEREGSGERKLSDRIKSVQRKVFLKRRRFEIYPHLGIDLNDAFYAHIVLGGSVGFHVVDALSFEGRFGYVLGSVEEEPVRFVRQAAGALPERPPRFELHGELDVVWAPLYGKVSLFGEGILHFDTYLAVGGGVFKTDAGTSPAANFAFGQRYFINDWLVARAEVRNYLFPDTREGETDIQNLLLVNLSVSFFLPFGFEHDYQ